MRRPSLAFWLVTPATLGLLAPDPVRAASPAADRAAAPVRDVVLGDDSALAGTVNDLRGQPLPGVEVLALQAGNPVARTTTSADGLFRIVPLRGGIYEVAAAGGGGLYRVWTPGTAPPGATGSIRVVTGSAAVRGQSPGTGFLRSDAFLIGAAVLGAVAIPVVILAARREQPPAS